MKFVRKLMLPILLLCCMVFLTACPAAPSPTYEDNKKKIIGYCENNATVQQDNWGKYFEFTWSDNISGVSHNFVFKIRVHSNSEDGSISGLAALSLKGTFNISENGMTLTTDYTISFYYGWVENDKLSFEVYLKLTAPPIEKKAEDTIAVYTISKRTISCNAPSGSNTIGAEANTSLKSVASTAFNQVENFLQTKIGIPLFI